MSTTLPEVNIEGNARDAEPLSVLSGRSEADQRAGRTDQEIIEHLERAVGAKSMNDLILAAGLGPVANISAIRLEAIFIERGDIRPRYARTEKDPVLGRSPNS